MQYRRPPEYALHVIIEPASSSPKVRTKGSQQLDSANQLSYSEQVWYQNIHNCGSTAALVNQVKLCRLTLPVNITGMHSELSCIQS